MWRCRVAQQGLVPCQTCPGRLGLDWEISNNLPLCICIHSDLLQVVVLAAGVNDFANASLDATSRVAGGGGGGPGAMMPLYQWLDEYEGLVREVS